MAIKLLGYTGDTAGLSSLQIIISQKADNCGSIGSVKTVIGEMGHWEAPLWELLCGGGRMKRTVAYGWYGTSLRWSGDTAVWWTEDAIPVQLMGMQLEACRGVSPSFMRELKKKIVRWPVVMTSSLTWDFDGSATLTDASRSPGETMLI